MQNEPLRIAIVIPMHNEERFIRQTLDSLLNQSYPIDQLIVVDDHSSDRSAAVVENYLKDHPFMQLVRLHGDQQHLPGSKVIRAFQAGYDQLDPRFDLLCKFDADLIFPKDYLQVLVAQFKADPLLGIAGGFCYILKENDWVLEDLTNPDHVRGALKTYRKACFEALSGLQPVMGWDTVDELLAQFYGWKVKTLAALKVKHLKPTGKHYNKAAKLKQGEAFYRLGYGFWLTTIAAAKLAWKKRKVRYFADYLQGYFRALKNKEPLLVNRDQAQFIRKLRWKGIRKKLWGPAAN
ncbi:glycosyltransferase family 2 protein [Croceiramulus getboli]|nr:glycosyltransferase [Flavobacteriaceae bacterium YJPT1-3]